MNLRVDLILPTEQRSASVVSLKSLIRIAIIVVPIIILLAIAMGVLYMLSYRNDFKDMEEQWKDAQPKQEAAGRLRQELIANEDLAVKVAGWATSRLLWHEQLRGIQKAVQPEFKIQLLRLALSSSQFMVDNRIPARGGGLVVQGLALGENAEANVRNLQQAFLTSPALTGCVTQVEVKRFEASTVEKATKYDRFFQIDLNYAPRKFQ